MKTLVANWKMELGVRESVALARGVLRGLRGVKEVPNVVQMGKDLPQLNIIGISLDGREDADKVKSFAKEYGMTYTLFIDEAQTEPVADKYGILSIPFTLLINPEGKVLYKYLRDTDMISVVKSAMGV